MFVFAQGVIMWRRKRGKRINGKDVSRLQSIDFKFSSNFSLGSIELALLYQRTKNRIPEKEFLRKVFKGMWYLGNKKILLILGF